MIIDNRSLLGESPLWNKFDEKFYWVDILGKKIKSYDGNQVYEFDTNKLPCCITLSDANMFTLVLENEIGIYDLRSNTFNGQYKMNNPEVRFNDGKLDKNGILYIGTMDRNEQNFIGNIFRYENSYLETIKSNIGITNGLSFDNENKMYYSDSLSGDLFYNNKIINHYETKNETPDGSCIDKDNKYYSCIWGGSRIDVYDNLQIKDKIKLPFLNPTCCCYGGKENDKLFITSSSIIDSKGDNGKVIII